MVWIVVIAVALVGLVGFARYAMQMARAGSTGPDPERRPVLSSGERSAFERAWKTYERRKVRGG